MDFNQLKTKKKEETASDVKLMKDLWKQPNATKKIETFHLYLQNISSSSSAKSIIKDEINYNTKISTYWSDEKDILFDERRQDTGSKTKLIQ